MEKPSPFQCQHRFRGMAAVWPLVLLLGWLQPARAEMQFDAFVGYGMGAYDGVVAEANWFPVVCEIFNDGPGFNGVVEVSGGQLRQGQRRFVPVELPTGTRKRLTIPVYAAARWGLNLEVRLRDDRGRVRAEHSGLKPRLVTDGHSPLLGGLSRTLAGAPLLPEVPRNNRNNLQPAATRMIPELFPDNPIALGGLSHLYVHSAKALELKADQVKALLAWLHAGGHLIVGVESPTEVNGNPWLKPLLPCEITGMAVLEEHGALQSWLTAPVGSLVDESDSAVPRPQPGTQSPRRSPRAETVPSKDPYRDLQADPAFEQAPLPIATSRWRDGAVLIGSNEEPLVLRANRGRGRITVLLFSPDLKPFETWKHKAWFWARLADVPPAWLAGANAQRHYGHHIDGVFGAMTDSKQIRKLPVGWLLVLLVAYLAVIGPVDQYVLKKLNRQMLTWITFPLYVAFFSLLIYLIGYKLRAGEREWNEFHVIDVIPHGERADWRGRTYCAAYSPANARYPVGCDAPYANLRGEQGAGGGSQASEAIIQQNGNSFTAELVVPVWTSQLFLSDWWRQEQAPLNVTLSRRGSDWQVVVQNRSDKNIADTRLVFQGRIHSLGEVRRSQSRTFTIGPSSGEPLQNFIQQRIPAMQNAVSQRQRQFAGRQTSLGDYCNVAVAASFAAAQDAPRSPDTYFAQFMAPRDFYLNDQLERGDAVLLAWIPEETLVPPLNRFKPLYSHQYTLLRQVVTVRQP